MTDEEGDVLRTACRESLAFLCQRVLGYVDWDEVHDDLEKFLLRPSRRKLILIPRGHLKTSIITKAWSIQQILKNPDIRILIVNQVWDKAREMLHEIKGNLERSELKSLFGNFVSDRWNLNEIEVRQRTEALSSPTIGTAGVEAELTSTHYNIILLDDLQGLMNVQTKEQRDKVKRFYRSVFNLLEPGGEVLIPGTRWHEDDLYSDILEKEGSYYDVMTRKVVEKDSEGRERLIFPKKFGLKFDKTAKSWIATGDPYCLDYVDFLKKTLGYEYYSQYENNPVNNEDRMFQKGYFQYWGKRPENLFIGITIDPAIALKDESDFTAIVVVGMDEARNYFVLDYIRGHWTPYEIIENTFQKWEQWGAEVVGLETQGFQQALKYAFEDEMRHRGKYFPITEIQQSTKESKELRIQALEPYYRSKQIWHAAWMADGDLEKELLEFPRSKRDDLVDALSMHLRLLMPGNNMHNDILRPDSWEGAAEMARRARRGTTAFYDYW